MTHKKIDHLEKQLNELFQQGQLRQAIDIATQISHLIRQDTAVNYKKLAIYVEIRALLYYRIHDYDKAEPLYYRYGKT